MDPAIRRTTRGLLAAVLASGVVVGLAHAASAAPVQRYVSASAAGNPSCAAASRTNPFATIAGALACSVNGTVVNIGPGTFAGGVTLPANVTLSGAGTSTVIAGSPVPFGTVVTVPNGRTVTLRRLTVDGQSTHADVSTGAARTTLLSVTLENGAGSPSGGISVNPTAGNATLVVQNSTLTGNLALQAGGGIAALSSPTGTTSVTVDNSTISGNTSNGRGGGIYVDAAPLTVLDSTIADNSGTTGGGIATINDPTPSVSLGNTVLAHNTAGTAPDCSANPALTIVDRGHNLLGQNTGSSGTGCPGIVDGIAGSQVGTAIAPIDPLLAPLAANGGPTTTRALMLGSPALGTGGASNCTVAPVSNKDQRGTTRTTAIRTACDIGAYDTGGTSLETLYVRTSAASDPACGAATQAHPFLTIAAALACAHHGTTVNIGAGNFAGDLTVPANITLLGAGPSTVITGGPDSAAPEVTIPSGRTVTLRNLTVNGQTTRADVLAGGASTTLLSVTLTGGAGAPAGGISATPSSGDASLDIRNSTLSGNLGLQGGGAIAAVASPSGSMSVALTNSTVTGNSSNSTGGGIYLGNASLISRNSTIAGNMAGTTGGGLQITPATSATVTLVNTLLAGNTAPQGVDCDSNHNSVVDGGHNLIGQNTGALGTGCPGLTDGVNGTHVGTTTTPIDPHLGVLAANGGPTATRKLQAGSPAIGAAAPASCKSAPVSNLDQRGVKRTTATRKKCDIGAYDTAGKV